MEPDNQQDHEAECWLGQIDWLTGQYTHKKDRLRREIERWSDGYV